MVHAPSARLRPVSGVRRCYRADKRNLERYAFPPSAIGIDCDRHHWLGCQGNHRFRCQHDAILSQVTGTSAPVSLSLPNRLPQQSYLPLPQSTDLELTTSSGLCVFRLDTTSLLSSSVSSPFLSYLVHLQHHYLPSTGHDRRHSFSMFTSGKRKVDAFSCTSAARVTARLALSFLALSTTTPVVNAFSYDEPNAQIVIPIEARPIQPLIPEPPAPAEHKFVRSRLILLL